MLATIALVWHPFEHAAGNWHVPLGYPKRSHVATVRKVLEQVVKKDGRTTAEALPPDVV